MQTVSMEITPVQAELWLREKNTRNRPLSLTNAAMYASDMKSGKWHETHQGIGFYEDGVLADGQTRLKAISIAGIPVTMSVTFGIKFEACIGIDAHRMRTTPDQIAIAGIADWIGADEVAIARMLLAYKMPGKRKLTTTSLVEFCESRKESIVFAVSCMRTQSRFLTSAALKCAVSLAYKYEDHEMLRRFCNVVTTGMMESLGDMAAIRLRERLLQDGRLLQGSGEGRNIQARLAERAIKAFCSRTELGKLVAVKDEIYKF